MTRSAENRLWHSTWQRGYYLQLGLVTTSSMLHGSETWPVRKKNVAALQRAEMRMVRWMYGVKLKDILPSKELRERLGIDDIALVLQQNRLRWYGHVLRKDDDWVVPDQRPLNGCVCALHD